jgi:hypothetical protein
VLRRGIVVVDEAAADAPSRYRRLPSLLYRGFPNPHTSR